MSAVPLIPREYQSFRSSLPGLFYLTIIFLTNFFSRIIFAPFLPVIERDMGLSHTDSGSFFLLISAGYFLSILSSGFVSSRISHKRTIVLSTIGNGIILCLMSLSVSLYGLRFGLFCLGLSAGLYLPSGLASISRLISPGYLARGIAIHELAPNIGFVLVPLISTFLLTQLSWSQSLLVIGIILICIGIIYDFSRTSNVGYGKRPDFTSYMNILSNREFWLLVVMFSLAICSTLGLYTMLPLFLVADHTIDLTHANNIIALSRISSVLMPIVGGWAGDRFSHRGVMMFVLVGGGLVTIPMGFVEGNLLLFFIFLQPMVTVCFFPSAFAVLTNTGKIGDGSMVVSLCIPMAFLAGGGLMPTLIGFVGDYYSLSVGFALTGIICCIGGLLSALYWQKNDTFSPQG